VPIDEFDPLQSPPDGVGRGEVCALSGLAPNAACPRRTSEWVLGGAQPAICTWHHSSDEGLITVLPHEYREWRGSAPPRDVRSEPAAAQQPRVTQPASSDTFAITSPLAGAVFLYDPTLRAEFQTMPLRLRGGTGRVEWAVDDEVVGSADANEAVRWPLTRGTHTIRARDAAGRTVETRVVVR
jgi:membrane carboxypeptidase/penicillin-binding protein PbpC